ncbi:MAG: quinone-dependent dihydroorotate dehydrogenase [Chloroflexota bacterium]|nr:quinone-dependent dihydroorotate dehydrogenase [Chloroflexota bacterium]
MSLRVAAYRALRPLLFATDSEAIHHLTLNALRAAPDWLLRLASGVRRPDVAPVDLMGLHFRNPIGLGAGFDKDALALRAWAALGFGFVEVGTVTPLAQPGNPRPRLFRLARDEALINRMGFNNDGAVALASRVAAARPGLPEGFVIGVNIGRNRDTPVGQAKDDYLAAYRAVAPVADYVAINVSSPNTPGLRDLQEPTRLVELVGTLAAEGPMRPLVVKLAPDLAPGIFDALVRALADSPARGLILANTTVSRPALRSGVEEAGGLSGAPLLPRTLELVAGARELAGDRLVIVAAGGIGPGVRIPGADLLQVWTALVYQGPGLIGELVRSRP